MNMDKNFKLKQFHKSRTLIGKIKNLRPTMKQSISLGPFTYAP